MRSVNITFFMPMSCSAIGTHNGIGRHNSSVGNGETWDIIAVEIDIHSQILMVVSQELK